MNIKWTFKYILCLSAIVISGCAGVSSEQYDRILQENGALKDRVEDTRARLDELGNKFSLLNEKLDASRATVLAMEKTLSERAPLPPEGLKVVNLNEEDSREGAIPRAPVSAQKPEPQAMPQGKGKRQEERDDSKGPDALYAKAQDFFLSGDYAVARKVFSDLARLYPQSSLADNALYWIGEAYYSEKNYALASRKFSEVAEKYPNENKAPDALLKAAFSYMELKEVDKSREFLEMLIRRYPGTEAALKAKNMLEKTSGTEKEGER